MIAVAKVPVTLRSTSSVRRLVWNAVLCVLAVKLDFRLSMVRLRLAAVNGLKSSCV